MVESEIGRPIVSISLSSPIARSTSGLCVRPHRETRELYVISSGEMPIVCISEKISHAGAACKPCAVGGWLGARARVLGAAAAAGGD